MGLWSSSVPTMHGMWQAGLCVSSAHLSLALAGRSLGIFPHQHSVAWQSEGFWMSSSCYIAGHGGSWNSGCLQPIHAVLWKAGLWASFPACTLCCVGQQGPGCLLTLLLTFTAISTDLRYCENLLVTDFSTAARGPSPRQVRWGPCFKDMKSFYVIVLFVF